MNSDGPVSNNQPGQTKKVWLVREPGSRKCSSYTTAELRKKFSDRSSFAPELMISTCAGGRWIRLSHFRAMQLGEDNLRGAIGWGLLFLSRTASVLMGIGFAVWFKYYLRKFFGLDIMHEDDWEVVNYGFRQIGIYFALLAWWWAFGYLSQKCRRIIHPTALSLRCFTLEAIGSVPGWAMALFLSAKAGDIRSGVDALSWPDRVWAWLPADLMLAALAGSIIYFWRFSREPSRVRRWRRSAKMARFVELVTTQKGNWLRLFTMHHFGIPLLVVGRCLCWAVVMALVSSRPGSVNGGDANIHSLEMVYCVLIASVLLYFEDIVRFVHCALNQMDGHTLLRCDPRKPILYLRPFKSDAEVSLIRWFERDSTTERMTSMFSPFGPVITVRNDKTIMPVIGPCELYPSFVQCRWHRLVWHWIENGACVIFRLGASPGIRCELGMLSAKGRNHWGKTIFFLPDGNALSRDQAWNTLKDVARRRSIIAPSSPSGILTAVADGSEIKGRGFETWRQWLGGLQGAPLGPLEKTVDSYFGRIEAEALPTDQKPKLTRTPAKWASVFLLAMPVVFLVRFTAVGDWAASSISDRWLSLISLGLFGLLPLATKLRQLQIAFTIFRPLMTKVSASS